MKRLCIWVLFLLSGLLTLQAQESGPHSPRILGLDCSGRELSSLDVSGCPSLTYLNCFNTQLSSLDVSGCTSLVYLNCASNQISRLDVGDCLALTELICYNNKLEILDMSSGNSALTRIDCRVNQLSSLYLYGSKALRYLDCGYNPLCSLGVEGCTALTTLYCYGTPLSSLDVSEFTALTELSCWNNQLSSLDVSANTALTSLRCDGNQLSILDVSANTALTYLDCGDNQLSSLDVSANTALTSLRCEGNQLSSLDISANTALRYLYCDNNQLSSLDVSANTALMGLSCSNNQLISLDVSDCTALKELSSVEADTLRIYGESIDTLTIKGVDRNTYYEIGVLDAAGCTTLHQITCTPYRDSYGKYYGSIGSINLQGCTALQSLDCRDNQLSSLDVSGCTALKELGGVKADTLRIYGESMDTLTIRSASGSKYKIGVLDAAGCTTLRQISTPGYSGSGTIGSLNLQGCTALTGLSCYGNKLSSIDVSGCTALKELSSVEADTLRIYGESMDTLTIKSYYSQIGVLDAAGCTTLRQITSGNYTSIGSINLQGCTALTNLTCGNSHLSGLDVSGCTALTSLSCGGNQLSGLDVSSCTALTSLYCSDNQLSGLDVSANTALTSLRCEGNQLSNLDVSGCTALTSLYCKGNQLSNLDMSGCTALMSLDCRGNQLSNLDVSGCTALKDLYCYNNQLSSLDVSGCTSLRELRAVTADTLRIYGESMDKLTIDDIDINTYYKIGVLDAAGCTTLGRITCPDFRYCNSVGECEYCGTIGRLNLQGCTALTRLDCSNRQLSSIDVSGCTALTWLYCRNNQLSSLDVSGCTALAILECSNNQLSNLDVSGCTALTRLSCDGNQLSNLDVSGCTALKELIDVTTDTLRIYGESMDALTIENGYSDYYKIGVLDAAGCTTLRKIVCDPRRSNVERYSPLGRLNLQGCTALKELIGVMADTLRIYGESMDMLTISSNSTYIHYEIGVLDVAGCTTLNQITCTPYRDSDGKYYGSLGSINLQGCTALASLNCSNNQLSGLDVSANTALTSLRCDGNQLSNLDVSANTALTSLNCSNNQLSSLDVSANTALASLSCSNNQLSGLDVSANTALTSLNCSNNQLSSIDVSGCTALTWLSCAGNQLSSLDVSANTALWQLDCYNNQLSSLDVSANTALWQLDCYNNQLSSLDVSANTALSDLYCYNNQLSGLDVSANTALRILDCHNNRIPLSMLYKAYSQRRGWSIFSAAGQSDSIIVWLDRYLDLSSEKILWQTPTTVALTDAYGGSVSSDSWTENGFVFQFHKPGNYQLKLTNAGIGSRADFTWHVSVEVPRYTVQVACNNSGWGTATMTGSGTYEEGSLVTITATPNDGYRFVNWTEKDGSVFTTEEVHTFTVTENLELTANFEEVPRYTMQVACNNSGWGTATVTGNGTYEEGSQVTITATPKEGYRFVNWTKKNGAVFATEAVYTFVVTENLELTANFEKIPEEVESFRVVLASNNHAYGSVSQTGNGTYEEGSQVTITATPKDGYRFVNWTKKDGSVLATEAVHTFTVTENVELTANFEKISEEVESFTVVLAANNNAYGRVSQSGNGTYEDSSQVTITATPKDGYRFVNWTKKDGSVLATEAVHTFTVTENVELTANFEKIPEEVETFTVVLAANNNAYGRVSQSGNGTYEDGSQVTITATSNEGYRFVNWTRKDGTVFTTEAVHTFTVTENMELTANFEKIPEEVESFTVVLVANNNAYGRVSQSGNGTYEEGAQVTITATPNAGYRFVNWTRKNGSVFSTEAVHTFTVTENVELTANFEKKSDVANENREDNGFYVYVQDHTIHLSAGRGVVQVYNAAGVCVYSGQSTAIPVQSSGLYIVRIGERAYKAMVR